MSFVFVPQYLVDVLRSIGYGSLALLCWVAGLGFCEPSLGALLGIVSIALLGCWWGEPGSGGLSCLDAHNREETSRSMRR